MIPSGQAQLLVEFCPLHLSFAVFCRHFKILLGPIGVPSLQYRSLSLPQVAKPPFLQPYSWFSLTLLLPLHLH